MSDLATEQDPTTDRARAVADARDFLARRHCLSLATTGPEGIWAATVFYVSRGFDLYFLSGARTRHVRNIDAHPFVAGTINDEAEDWLSIRGIQFEGKAEAVDRSRRREVLELFSLRYPFTDGFWWAESGTLPSSEQRTYRLKPSRVLYLDHRCRNARIEIPSELLESDGTRDSGPAVHV